MTYYGLFEEAGRLLEKNKISYGEYVKMVEPLNDEVQKLGKWEECKVVDIEDTTITEIQSAYCPICHKYHTTPYMYYFDYFNYCPNCGAKMERRTDDD